jgi:hypothetical protein
MVRETPVKHKPEVFMKLFRAFQNLAQQRILPSIGRRLFSAPYMPRPLVGLASFILLNDILLFLLRQSPEYWRNYQSVAENTAWIYRLLEIHPLFYLGLSLCYVVLVALLLDGLKYPLAMSLWAVVCLLHLYDSASMGSTILAQHFQFGSAAWFNLYWGLKLIIFMIFGISTATILFASNQKSLPQSIAKKNHGIARLIPRGVAIVWLIFLGVSLVQVINKPVTGWQRIPTLSSPGPRGGAEIAYDTQRRKAVLFGGTSIWLGEGNEIRENETWEWDGREWMQKFPETSPPARNAFTMAYDEKRGMVLLFGGQGDHEILRDTWEWDGQNWTQQTLADPPPARSNHKMIYDSRREKVVLYGGYDQSIYMNDAWEWDGEQWQSIVFESTHPLASGFAAAYDPTADYILAFLGHSTWIWENGTWGKLELSQEPSNRTATHIVYDPQCDHMVMYGGWDYDGNNISDETWIWKGLRWQLLKTTIKPPPLWDYAAFYDAARERVIIFGGFDGATYRDDLWELVLVED